MGARIIHGQCKVLGCGSTTQHTQITLRQFLSDCWENFSHFQAPSLLSHTHTHI